MQNESGMRRRDLLGMAAGGSIAGMFAASDGAAQENTARSSRGMPSPKIRDISVIATQPGGVRLTVVKVTTDQDGLYGYGCATFTQRADLVAPAVEKTSDWPLKAPCVFDGTEFQGASFVARTLMANERVVLFGPPVPTFPRSLVVIRRFAVPM